MELGKAKKLIQDELHSRADRGDKIFTSSSFQTHSLPLLHIVSEVPGCEVVYLTNTGYLFPETLEFASLVCAELGLVLKTTHSQIPKSQQRDSSGLSFYLSDPDLCCQLNKVQPLDPVIRQHDVWVNGVRGSQSDFRGTLRRYEQSVGDCVRFHPMLDWSDRDIYLYRKEFSLPPHPLEERGYMSIGCLPCTSRWTHGEDVRGSRWEGLKKTECGLNTDLIAAAS